ncbi:RHS repeat-associated core domain protein [Bacteroidales bacterium KA00251]|nr:RHS repeat-associated core domain protein [Bacteroidales bacterium KA00251]
MMIDGHKDSTVGERKLTWDEENRLLAVDENGFVSNYWYDADVERTVKTSCENEAIFVNSEFSGGNTGTARFSLYVNPYLVAGQGGKYTKHIYIGSQRIVSKLGDLSSYGADPRRIPYAGNEADGLTINYKDKYAQQLQSIKDNYKTFDIPYTGKDNNDYVNGQGFCCDDGTPEATQARLMARAATDGNIKPNEEYEKMQFYYHPDHLGSSSYITNLDGEVSQHIEYVPFGEVFIEERNNTWNTPYLFNAKELDEETGMYYYGARYYDPRVSLWISTDPKKDKYPNISAYCFTANNPVILEDIGGDSIRLTGSIEGINIYLDFLYKTTGNRYLVIDGFLTLRNEDDTIKGAKSSTLSNVINSGIASPKEYSLNIVGEKEDDINVFIDSYTERKIDVSDLKKLGEASKALQGALIGHYLKEIQVGGIFEDAHSKSLQIEGIIYDELIKDSSITGRTEHAQDEPRDGFQIIIFEYGPRDKFQLEQGATSEKIGTGIFLPNSKEIQTIIINSTGELRSVEKIPQ